MFRHPSPYGAFAATFVGIGVGLNPRKVPSPLLGKAAAAFRLSQLPVPERSFAPRDRRGQVSLFNELVASRCAACRHGHALLVDLARRKTVPIAGFSNKDSRTGIDSGVYGVPKTFAADTVGAVRVRHFGPLTPEVFDGERLPLLQDLNNV